MRAFGIDLSPRSATSYTYQPYHDFVMVGVSDGTYKIDGKNALLREACKAPVTMAYHYLRFDQHWKDQINVFLAACAGFEIDAYAVDFEKRNNMPGYDFAYMSKLVIDKLTTDTNKRATLYSSPSVVQEWMYPYEIFYIRRENYFMHCAQYPYYGYNNAMDNVTDPASGWEPRLPAGVTDWKFWQYSADGNYKAAENGVTGNLDVDLDVFNGTLNDLKVWAKMQPPVPPIPPPDDCKEVQVAVLDESIAAINAIKEAL